MLKGSLLNYIFAPYVLIQPMDLTSAKLSEVETALLKGLVYDAKISGNTLVWNGDELSDMEAVGKLEKFIGKSFRVK